MTSPKNPDFVITASGSNEINASFLSDGLSLDDHLVNYELLKISDIKYQIIHNQKAYDLLVLNQSKDQYEILINGKLANITVKNKISQLLESLGMDASVEEVINAVDAPMPGSILKIMVEVGSDIEEGQPVLILEAMKMENVIKSPRTGIIKNINVTLSQSVEKGQQLISFE